MKVKANWPVDTGKKVHDTDAEFDLSPVDAKALEALGAVEILSRKKGGDPPASPPVPEAPDGDPDDDDDEGGQGGDGSGPPA